MTEPSGLAAALASLQAQLPHVGKDATNPHFKSRYATLEAISAALLPVMSALGLSFTCAPGWHILTGGSPARFVLRYQLLHSPTGEHIEGHYPLPESGNPQQIGSAITYARRYSLCAVTGLAPDDDDDGNEASGPPARASRMTPAQQKAARTPDPARGKTPTEQRETRARRTAEERAVAQARAQDRPMDRGPLPDADNAWQDATPEDRPGSIGTGQRKGLEALLGQFYGLASTDRDGRHAAVQQLLSLETAPASMLDLSYSQAKAARDKIVAIMAERGREAKLAAAGPVRIEYGPGGTLTGNIETPDHAQAAANDDPWADWPA